MLGAAEALKNFGQKKTRNQAGLKCRKNSCSRDKKIR
jgi:hypothetical protein